MVTFLVLYRGESVDEAKPIAVCTKLRVIGKVAQLLLSEMPSTESADPVLIARQLATTEALQRLQELCSQ